MLKGVLSPLHPILSHFCAHFSSVSLSLPNVSLPGEQGGLNEAADASSTPLQLKSADTMNPRQRAQTCGM